MDKRAIGIFDSGIGGLTALKAVNGIMPTEDVIYFGDTKNVPYGEKSKEEIIECARRNIDFLKNKGVKIVLAACGTVSSQLKCIKSDIPVFGIIEATCKTAVTLSANGNIGVLATSRTVESGIYKNTCLEISPGVHVREYACPRLATIIENGGMDFADEELRETLEEYLKEVNSSDIDVLILGCTHYAIIEGVIRSLLHNKDIILVNPGKEVAKYLKEFMEEHELATAGTRNGGKTEYYVSGDKDKFINSASKYLEYSIEKSTFSTQ